MAILIGREQMDFARDQVRKYNPSFSFDAETIQKRMDAGIGFIGAQRDMVVLRRQKKYSILGTPEAKQTIDILTQKFKEKLGTDTPIPLSCVMEIIIHSLQELKEDKDYEHLDSVRKMFDFATPLFARIILGHLIDTNDRKHFYNTIMYSIVLSRAVLDTT